MNEITQTHLLVINIVLLCAHFAAYFLIKRSLRRSDEKIDII